jgi:hypothetical protein
MNSTSDSTPERFPASFSRLFGPGEDHPIDILSELCAEAGHRTETNSEDSPVRLLTVSPGLTAAGEEIQLEGVFLDEAARLLGGSADRLFVFRLNGLLAAEFPAARLPAACRLIGEINLRLAPGGLSLVSAGDGFRIRFQDCYTGPRDRFRPDVALDLLNRHADILLRLADPLSAAARGEEVGPVIDALLGPCPPGVEHGP